MNGRASRFVSRAIMRIVAFLIRVLTRVYLRDALTGLSPPDGGFYGFDAVIYNNNVRSLYARALLASRA